MMKANTPSIKEKIARYFGAQSPEKKGIEKPGPLLMDTYHYPSFCAQLPYRYYDEDSQVFHNRHNSGLLYELSPLTGANETVEVQLDNLLREKVNDAFTVTVYRVTGKHVGGRIDCLSDQFRQCESYDMNWIGDNLEAYYKQAAKIGFKTGNGVKAGLWDTRCYLVIDLKTAKLTEKEAAEQMVYFRQDFEAGLTAMRFGFSRCGADDFLHLMQQLLLVDPDAIYDEDVEYDPAISINEQLVDRSFECEVKHDYIAIGFDDPTNHAVKTHVSVLSLNSLPKSHRLWSNIDLDNSSHDKYKNIQCPHVTVMIYRLEAIRKTKDKAKRKTKDLKKKQGSDYRDQDTSVDEQSQVWREHRLQVEKGEARTVNCAYFVLLYSRPKERRLDVAMCRETFGLSGLRMGIAKRLQLPYVLAALPFMFSGEMEYGFALPSMMWSLSSWTALQFLPLLADWRGSQKGILLPTLRGQMAAIDLQSDDFGTNFNGAITGTSGSGKSFLVQMMILDALASGGDVMVLDVGGSYKKTCETLGGVYITQDNLRMNPFTFVDNILESIAQITELFTLLAGSTSTSDANTIRKAILNAFREKGKETKIDDVQSALMALYDENATMYGTAPILAKNLDSYCLHAEHGHYFNESSVLDPNARFTVVDLMGLKDNKDIIFPVLLTVFAQFRRRIYHSPRSRFKLCMIDEAWSMFKDFPIAADFINEGFRTGRRHNAGYYTITQGIEDYYSFAEAQGPWDNSAKRFIFCQDPAALKKHLKTHDSLTPEEAQAVMNFSEAKIARYSQVLFKAKNKCSYHSLFVDPVTLVMLSSSGADYEAVEYLVNPYRLFLLSRGLDQLIGDLKKGFYLYREDGEVKAYIFHQEKSFEILNLTALAVVDPSLFAALDRLAWPVSHMTAVDGLETPIIAAITAHCRRPIVMQGIPRLEALVNVAHAHYAELFVEKSQEDRPYVA